MKFHIAINLERMDDTVDMRAVRDHTIEMVQMADKGGFEIAWAAEHHALEMTIAPNPFQLMTWWADHTQNIRIGCGVANAGGRLELGLGSGAYQREFDRMRPGLDQKEGYKYLQEMLPLVQKLWQGDVEHNGEFWQFPTATSCPKPLQDSVPMWVAARSPITFDYAVENNCNIMCWPLTLPFSEAEKYRGQLDQSIAKAGNWTGQLAFMRHTAVYETEQDRQSSIDAIRHALGKFGNVMTNSGEVVNGFPDSVPLDELDGNARVNPAMLEENLLFGSSDTVIEKLKAYETLGVDSFIYYASMGLDMETQKRSLDLFINRVMPEFT